MVSCLRSHLDLLSKPVGRKTRGLVAVCSNAEDSRQFAAKIDAQHTVVRHEPDLIDQRADIGAQQLLGAAAIRDQDRSGVGASGGFRQLPAKLQAAASLALIEEESNAEIAAALGISVAAVKSRIHRSIGLLRKSLRRLHATL